MYIPRFRNIKEKRSDYLRGFAYECYSGRGNWQQGYYQMGMGADFKNELSKPGPWQMLLIGYGECLPNQKNRVTLNTDKKDKWGLPTLNLDMQYRENELTMRKDMEASSEEMLAAVGMTSISPLPLNPTPGGCIHEMGTARMGNDPKTSLLNRFNQCHDVPNLFITDGSCMVSTACQNPSLTYMALTARACDYAVTELKKGTL
jgi:choline dehydrogenase-like flavoprotein